MSVFRCVYWMRVHICKYATPRWRHFRRVHPPAIIPEKKVKKKKFFIYIIFFPDYLLFTFVRVVIKYSCVKSIRRFGQIDVGGDVRQGAGERRTRRLLEVSDVGKERTEEEGSDSHSTHTLHRLTSHRLRKQLVLRHSNNSCHFISHVPFLKPDF